MKEISLTKGKVAIVDDEDFEYLNQWKWSFDGSYATRSKHIKINKNKYKSKKVYLHHLLVDRSNGVIDYKKRNKLDNRRLNVRVVSVASNIRNGKLRKNNKSGITGVYFDKNKHKWLSQIMVNKKHISLGAYESKELAIKAREQGENKYYEV